jgi:hypothetical protein
MAMRVTKEDVWAGDLSDIPGGLARVLEALGGARASLDCVIARRRPDRPGSGVVFVTPVSAARVQQAAREAGLSPAADVATLRVEGADKPGLGGRVTRAVADAGVNLRGLSAAVLGTKFVAYLGFDSQADADKAMAAIKALDAARPAAKARAKRPAAGRGRAKR